MKKKFQRQVILFFATLLSRPLLLLYRSTFNIRVIGSAYLKQLRKQGKSFILCLWHENMTLPLLVHEGEGISVLVSQHFDGEIIARILHSFGLKSIRGSSTRGGKEAYREMKEKMKTNRFEVAFTPDGPTGPRRQAKLGVVRLASETGVPILPMSVAASRARQLKSWDRFLLIFPFSRCILMYGKPVYLPPTLSEEKLIGFADKIAGQLNFLQQEAESCL